jgi:hypothetical protein
MKLTHSLLLMLSLSWYGATATAFEITLKEQQVTGLAALSFPISQSYQGLDFTLTNPNVGLRAASQEITVNVDLVVVQQSQSLRANATVIGKLNFDRAANRIEIIQPGLLQFVVKSNTLTGSDEAIRLIKQRLGDRIPGIFLIDMAQLQTFLPGIQAKDVRITSQGLVLSL